VDCFFQSENVLHADVFAQHAGEGAVTARVGGGLAEDGDIAIARNHGVGRAHDAGDIGLSDSVVDHAATTFALHVHGALGGFFEGGLLAMRAGDFGQTLAGECGVETAVGNCDVLGVAAAAAFAQVDDNLSFDAGAGFGSVEALHRGFLAAFESPLR